MLNPDRFIQEAAPDADARAFRLKDLLKTIYNRKWIFMLSVLLGIVGAYLLSKMLPARYAAEAILIADPPSSRIIDLRLQATTPLVDPMAIRTVVETIGSALIIERAIQSVPANVRAELAKAAPKRKLSPIPFCPTSVCGPLVSKENEPVSSGPDTGDVQDLRHIVNYVTRDLEVRNGGRSYVIQVRYLAPVPETSAVIANAVVHEYLAYLAEQKRHIYEQTEANLGTKLAALKLELQAADQIAQTMREQIRLQELRSGSLTGSKQEQAISENAQAYARLREAERAAQAIAAVYENFLLRQREIEGRQDFPETDVRLLSLARVPLEPTGLNARVLLVLGLLTGVLAGTSITVVISRRKQVASYD